MIKLKEMTRKQLYIYLTLKTIATLIVVPTVIYLIRFFFAGPFEAAEILSNTPSVYFILNLIMVFLSITLIIVSRAYRLSLKKTEIHQVDSNAIIIGGSGVGTTRRNLIYEMNLIMKNAHLNTSKPKVIVLEIKEENKINGDKNNLAFIGPFKFVKSSIQHDKSILPTTSLIVQLNEEIFQIDLSKKSIGAISCFGNLGSRLFLLRQPFSEENSIFIRKCIKNNYGMNSEVKYASVEKSLGDNNIKLVDSANEIDPSISSLCECQ